MKVMVLMFAFLGVVSAVKLGHHTHHPARQPHPRPGGIDQGSGTGQPGPTLGQAFGPSTGQFGQVVAPGQGAGPSSGQFVPGQGAGPSSGQFGGSSPLSGQSSGAETLLIDASLTGIVTFDNHACVFRNGELRLLGPILNIGESGDFSIQAGTATLGTGQFVSIDNGLVNLRVLESTDTQALQNSLARAGITLDLFIQQTGTIPPQQGIKDVTAGVVSINGVLKNIRAGVFVVVAFQLVDTNSGVQPESCIPVLCGCAPGTETVETVQSNGCPGCSCVPTPQSCPQPLCVCTDGFTPILQQRENGCPTCGCDVQPIPHPATNPVDNVVRTVIVTETAAHETETVEEPVILTKTQTQDEFVTITSPVYNSHAVTITNIVKQTVTVPEEQVIRSPVAGSVVVNTIPVPTQTVLTVSVRSTNMFVRTVTDDVTNEHTHFITNYSISTATVNNPVTSTVVQTITQTRLSTVYNTSTLGSTIYTTTTTTVNIGTAGATQTPVPGEY